MWQGTYLVKVDLTVVVLTSLITRHNVWVCQMTRIQITKFLYQKLLCEKEYYYLYPIDIGKSDARHPYP